MAGKTEPKKRRPRERVHVIADAIPILATLGLLSEDDPNTQNESAMTKAGYALDALDSGDWSSPSGVAANVNLAFQAAADSIISTDGLIVEGLAFGARHLVKHSSFGRKTIFRTKHHSFGA